MAQGTQHGTHHTTAVRHVTQRGEQVLHATTCVPFVSEPCTFIEGAGPGLYCDGALGDYQLAAACRDPAVPVLLLAVDCPGSPIKATIWDSESSGVVRACMRVWGGACVARACSLCTLGGTVPFCGPRCGPEARLSERTTYQVADRGTLTADLREFNCAACYACWSQGESGALSAALAPAHDACMQALCRGGGWGRRSCVT
jgi:hypothetical protein